VTTATPNRALELGNPPVARPRWATRRRPERPTFGPAAARAGARLGTPFIPWQIDAADVVGEVLVDERGRPYRFAYPTVIVTVPRRAGKTAWVLATAMQRTSGAPRRRAWYTAQSRGDATTTFVVEWVPALERGRFPVDVRRSNGSEGVTVRPTGSTFRLFAPTGKALHGQATDLVVIDEAWTFDLARGGALEAAIRPTQATRRWRQNVIVSTRGTVESSWLDRWVAIGRAAAEDDRGRGIAYIEFSADDDADRADPATWWAAHPALGHTIDADFLADELATLDPAEFDRAYLNRPTGALTAALDPVAWQASATSSAPSAPVRLALDVSGDRATAAIVAAGANGVVEVVAHGPGTGWVAGRVRDLQIRHRSGPVLYDVTGPAGSLAPDLATARVETRPVNARELAAACGAIVDALTGPAFAYRPHDALTSGVTVARWRRFGDVRVLDRSAGDLSALLAGVLAWWASRFPEPVAGVL